VHGVTVVSSKIHNNSIRQLIRVVAYRLMLLCTARKNLTTMTVINTSVARLWAQRERPRYRRKHEFYAG